MSLEKQNPWFETLSLNPFRVFFPLGIVYGLIGVGEWVFWSVGWKVSGIALSHAAFQTQGFLASFVIGFLMTAFPRFTGTWPATKNEIILMVSFSAGFLVCETLHFWLIAQIFYLAMIVNLLVFAGRRVPQRKKELPESFLLMGFGFLHAVIGAVLIVGTRFGTAHYLGFSMGRQMIQLGFLLCIVLGVTGKLAPFLFGYTDDPEKESEKNRWLLNKRNAVIFHGFVGTGILVSFILEPYSIRWAAGLRAFLATLHLILFARIARPLRKKTTLMFFFFISCWMIPIGLWAGFLWPTYRIACLHIVFLGGFSLMIFSFGLLIVLSHSSQANLINGKLIPMKWVGTFVLIALFFRILADVSSIRYRSSLHISSGVWVLAALIWGVLVISKIRKAPNLQH